MPFDLSGVEIFGRVPVGGAFLIAALRNFMNFSTLQRLVEGAGLPFPAITLFAGLVTLAASSLCILTGYFLAWGGLGSAFSSSSPPLSFTASGDTRAGNALNTSTPSCPIPPCSGARCS